MPTRPCFKPRPKAAAGCSCAKLTKRVYEQSTGHSQLSQRRHGGLEAFGTGSEATQTSELISNLVRTQHKSHASGFDGTDRHAGKARRSRVLRERSPTGLPDGLYTQGTVRAAPREDDADCAIPTICGQRGE